MENMTRTERGYIEVIERRIKHLEKRLSNYKGTDPSWDRHELAALRWVLETAIEAYELFAGDNDGTAQRESVSGPDLPDASV